MKPANEFRASLQLRAVGRELARWREDAGLTGAEVSRRGGFSQSKVSKLENAAQWIAPADVVALGLIYGTPKNERDAVTHAAMRAHDPRLWDAMGRELPCARWDYSDVEAEASEIRGLATDVLPPILRTPEYALAVASAQAITVAEHVRPFGLERHRRQQDRLRADPPLRVQLVVGEAVLRQPTGGRRVMADQLVRLLALAELPSVTVRVLPSGLGAYPGMGTPFTVLSFTEERFDDVVHSGRLGGETWIESVGERLPYEEPFTKATGMACGETSSLNVIAEAVGP
ncbi:helix-turn-helix domain-containing protein [Solihabitans fulvus]|uniref:Helix-turn-helix domain-containing protein n=1 Tax=Solihabitans fulvus TaxID=1892852 RepID=A0A5B2XN72_9PSEU|nr:helix-turn-helix transcriptional regulator [Solihabitans fulvus]KAA2264816.1 helix-turn-helix domain-containing protein [Solihabitans fulvus]